MELFPRRKAAADLPPLKAVCLSLTAGKLTGGLLSQRANLLSWFHSITEAIIWDFYLSRKKLLMWARKCVLCHYATEATDFTLYWLKLNEPEAITPAKRRSQLRRCELPWTFKLCPGGNATSDPYVNILCTNCTAAQSPWWSRHFHRRRILLLVAAQCCLRALTPSTHAQEHPTAR